jgi:protein SERAC1
MWTAKNIATPWPQTLLPYKVPNARVLTFGYDANVMDWRGIVSKNRIGNHAMKLLTASNEPESTDTSTSKEASHSGKA